MTDTTPSTISQLLSDYNSFVVQNAVTITDYQNAARVLSCVFNAVLADPSADNLTEVWNFFVTNQNGSVQENIALYGVSVLTPNDRAVYNFIYTMFRQATNGLQPATTGAALAVLVRAPILVEFLQREALTVTPGTEMTPSGVTTVSSGATAITAVDSTKGISLTSGGELTFNDAAMTTYILGLLATFMTTAPTDPRPLVSSAPWSNGGNLAFVPTGP